MRCQLCVPLALLSALSLPASAQPRRMTLDDLGAIVSLGAPVFTPDGRSILVSAGRPNYETNRRDVEWMLVDVLRGTSRSVSLGTPGGSSPAWSRDGRVAFLAPASPAPNAVMQVWVADSLGAPARIVTDAPKGALDFAWSPDGASVAYLTADLPAIRSGPDRFNDGFVVGNDPYLMAAEPARVHLWVTPVVAANARRLTSGTWSLATSLNQSPIAWSPDGATIAVQRFASAHRGTPTSRPSSWSTSPAASYAPSPGADGERTIRSSRRTVAGSRCTARAMAHRRTCGTCISRRPREARRAT